AGPVGGGGVGGERGRRLPEREPLGRCAARSPRGRERRTERGESGGGRLRAGRLGGEPDRVNRGALVRERFEDSPVHRGELAVERMLPAARARELVFPHLSPRRGPVAR